MNLMQPVQILQTGMKFLFDLDPTITEQLYHHSLSQAALLTALSAQLCRTIVRRLHAYSHSGNTRSRGFSLQNLSVFR